MLVLDYIIIKMEWIFIMFIIGLMETVYLLELQDNNDRNQNFAVASFIDKNETTDVTNEVFSLKESQLSNETLSDIFSVAKNISHSKGVYQNVDKEEITSENEIRRSIRRKAIISSSSDIVKSILNQIQSGGDTLSLLDHMEYLVHQLDVAVSFAHLGGIQIITSLLFSSNDEIICSATLVLGASMQSNPAVQKIAFQQSLGLNLLKLLSHKSSTVISRTIFALAGYLRNFPEALEEFISAQGISKLSEILKNSQVAKNIKIKVLNLFSDLLIEHQLSQLNPNYPVSEQIQKVLKLFASELKNHGICQLISPLLDFDDLDTHEKVIAAMISLCDMCLSDFHNEKVIERIKYLINMYDPKIDNFMSLNTAEDMEVETRLYNELNNLLKKISVEHSKNLLEKNEL